MSVSCGLCRVMTWQCGKQPLDELSAGVSPFVVSEFVGFFAENGGDGPNFICTSYGDGCHNLFGDNFSVVRCMGVLLLSKTCGDVVLC